MRMKNTHYFRWQRLRYAAALLSAALCAWPAFAWPGDAPPQGNIQDTVRVLIANTGSNDVHLPQLRDYADALGRFYAGTGYAPVWFTGGRNNRAIATALAQIRAAPAQGLVASDYDLDWLAAESDTLLAQGSEPDRVAHTEVALTLEIFRFLSDVHDGRMHLRSAEYRSGASHGNFDVAAILRDALAQNQLHAATAMAQ